MDNNIIIPDAGRLDKVYMLDGKTDASALPKHVSLGAGARLSLSVIVLPGVSCDMTLSVDLDGPGAEADISGIYICPGAENVRISMDVRHNVHHCISRQLFKGIAGGESKSDFYGKITVAQDARKTEAYQENHNLLLSDKAKVDTKPQLEIYADDVKCSHGATIGRLNDEEQFYMRSRGIPENEARVLQMVSFVSPVLDRIGDGAVREMVASAAESAIRNMKI